MKNIQNQETLDSYMNEIFNILNSDNELEFGVIKPSIKNMIFTLYNQILKEILVAKIKQGITVIFQDIFKKNLYEINISVLKTELACFAYLFVNSKYLDDYNKEILIHYFNMLKYLLEIDSLRCEWLVQNSNDGRTILANQKIVDIENLYDATLQEFNQISELDNNNCDINIKGLKLNEK